MNCRRASWSAGGAVASGFWATRAPMLVRQWPNDRWSLDFASDQFITAAACASWSWSTTSSRECLALVPDTSISGIRVARELDRLLVAHGKPKTIVSDNGTELTSNAIFVGLMTTSSNGLHRTGEAGSERLRQILHRPLCAMSC